MNLSLKQLLLITILFINFSASSQTWNFNFGDSIYYRNPITNLVQNTMINSLFSVKNKLYAAGYFNRTGNNVSHRIVSWSNYQWSVLATHSWGGTVYDMAYYKNKLYIVGDFQDVDSINGLDKKAVWSGTNWNFISDYSHDSIMDIQTVLWKDNKMLIGGGFGFLDGVYYTNVAQMDSAGWHSMDGGMVYGYGISCSTVYNGDIYLGGNFSQLSQQLIYGVARWDGLHWQPVGTGLYGDIWSLVVDTVSNTLYAGGYLAIPGTNVAGGAVARWDGQQWTYVADSSDSNVSKLCFYRGNLYACGTFTYFDNKPINYFAKLTSSGWQPVANSMVGGVSSLTVFNDELIVGGDFNHINGNRAYGIARYYEPPDSACIYFVPATYTDADTFYLHNDTVSVQFYNNNSHANNWAWNFGDTGTDTVWCPVHVYNQPGTYTVNVNVTELWCNKSAQKTVVISDLLNSAQPTLPTGRQAELKIYPNPASGSITIEVTCAVVPFRELKGSAGSKNNELHITNSHGKIIKSYQIKEPNSKTEINTKGWAKGTYLCSLVVSGKTVKVEKLVIE